MYWFSSNLVDDVASLVWSVTLLVVLVCEIVYGVLVLWLQKAAPRKARSKGGSEGQQG